MNKEKPVQNTLKLVCFIISLVSSVNCHGLDWAWVINNTSSVFTGTENETSNIVTGPFSRLGNGFIEMEKTGGTGSDIPSNGTQWYPIEVVDFSLVSPNILLSETKLSYSVTAGACPGMTKNYNWIFTGWSESSDPSSSDQAIFGVAEWNTSTSKITFTEIWNQADTAPSWYTEDLIFDATACSSGQATLNGPAGTDRRGTLYLSNNGGFVYNSDAGNLVLGFEQTAIGSVNDLDGLYAGYIEIHDSTDTPANNLKPIRLVMTAGSTSKGNVLSDVALSTVDSGYGDFRLQVTEINSPANGMLKAQFERSGTTAQYRCMVHVTATPETLIFCAGNEDTDTAMPANIVMHTTTLATTGTLACNGGGDLATTCNVNDTQTLVDGDVVTANNIVIQSGGNITSAGNISLELVGDLTVQSGGTLTAGLTDVVVDDITINSGASIAANITYLLAENITIDASGSVDVSGLGGAGGVVDTTGSGTAPGTGSAAEGGGGAAHGGAGGNGGEVSGGAGNSGTYGSNTNPILAGSGGGGGDNRAGGAGGGIVILELLGTLTVNGTLTANGIDGAAGSNSGSHDGAGGGSGGSINLTTDTLAGSGTITSNGGNGGSDAARDDCGGGGGGGRIAANYVTRTFTPANATANGGLGGSGSGSCTANTQDGSAGTVYWNAM